MLARFRWLLLFLFALGGPGLARAGVEVHTLHEGNLAVLVPQAKNWDLHTGDVLLRNEYLQVVILGGPRPERAGVCLLAASDAPVQAMPFACQPAFQGGWSKAEAGSTPRVAVVRLRRDDGSWNAEMVYKLHDGTPWLELETTIHNTDDNQTLEIPVVDAVRVPGRIRRASDPSGKVFLQDDTGTTLAAVPAQHGYLPADGGVGRIYLGFASGDEQAGFMSRMGKRVVRFGRSSVYHPVDPPREWDRAQRGRDDWFRIGPNQNRLIARRMVVASSSDHARALMEMVGADQLPQVQLLPGSAPIPATNPGDDPGMADLADLPVVPSDQPLTADLGGPPPKPTATPAKEKTYPQWLSAAKLPSNPTRPGTAHTAVAPRVVATPPKPAPRESKPAPRESKPAPRESQPAPSHSGIFRFVRPNTSPNPATSGKTTQSRATASSPVKTNRSTASAPARSRSTSAKPSMSVTPKATTPVRTQPAADSGPVLTLPMPTVPVASEPTPKPITTGPTMVPKHEAMLLIPASDPAPMIFPDLPIAPPSDLPELSDPMPVAPKILAPTTSNFTPKPVPEKKMPIVLPENIREIENLPPPIDE